MTNRALMAAAVALAGLAAWVAVVVAGAGGSGAATTFNGPLMPPGLRAAAFQLRDHTGAPATLAQYRGRVLVMAFLHSKCVGACPVIAQQIRGAFDDLGPLARDARALAISVDPSEDTPRNVARFLRRQHVGGVLRYLIGTRKQLQPVWKAYAVQPVSRRFPHSTFVYLIDRKGVERVGFPLQTLTPENLAHDMRVLLRAS
jgi:protein SCO1/2